MKRADLLRGLRAAKPKRIRLSRVTEYGLKMRESVPVFPFPIRGSITSNSVTRLEGF